MEWSAPLLHKGASKILEKKSVVLGV